MRSHTTAGSMPRPSGTARRVWFVGAALLIGLALPGQASIAAEMTSPSYRLRNATLAGGGAVNLRSKATSPTVSARGTSIGQSGPLGVTETARGWRLIGGFWPGMTLIETVPVPEPGRGLLLTASLLTLAALRSLRVRPDTTTGCS